MSLCERIFKLSNEAATDQFGQRFAYALSNPNLSTSSLPAAHRRADEANTERPSFAGLHVHLIGDIGVGKTTLVRAMLRALGYAGHVRSPTYTLVEPYSVLIQGQAVNIYHFDLYRFSDPAEWIDAGFRDYFNSRALCLVEWPQQAAELIGVPDLTLTFEMLDSAQGRRLIVCALTGAGKICIESLGSLG